MAKQLNQQRLKQIQRQLKRINAEIRKLLQAEDALERQREILTSIPRISDVTAAGLIIHMPELGTLTGSRAASLAGLAPVTRESGSYKGRSFIQGGTHHVRRMLYMPALVAIWCNPDLKRKYETLVAKGKPPEGRPDGRDAEAPRPRQHARPAGPHLGDASAARILLSHLPDALPRRAVVTDDRAGQERASTRRRGDGRCESGRSEKKGHPLDMDTTGWNDSCRAGLAPAGKTRLSTAHDRSGLAQSP